MKKGRMLAAAAAVAILAVFAVPFAGFAEERAATEEEIAAVTGGTRSAYSWENAGTCWKLLFLNTSSSSWEYARSRWVKISDRYYYFDSEGAMAEGWFMDIDNGVWFFADPDSIGRDNPNAGVNVTGWAQVYDELRKPRTYYFGKDINGRPTGMYSGENGVFKAYEIDGRTYHFDPLGYCIDPPDMEMPIHKSVKY